MAMALLNAQPQTRKAKKESKPSDLYLSKYAIGFHAWSRALMDAPALHPDAHDAWAAMAYQLVGAMLRPSATVYGVCEATSRLLSIPKWHTLVNVTWICKAVHYHQSQWSVLQRQVLGYLFLRWIVFMEVNASKPLATIKIDHDMAMLWMQCADRDDEFGKSEQHDAPMAMPLISVKCYKSPSSTKKMVGPAATTAEPDHQDFKSCAQQLGPTQGFANRNNGCALEVFWEILVNAIYGAPQDPWVLTLSQPIRHLLKTYRLQNDPSAVHELYKHFKTMPNMFANLFKWGHMQSLDAILERGCDHCPYSLISVENGSKSDPLELESFSGKVSLTWLFSRLDLRTALGLVPRRSRGDQPTTTSPSNEPQRPFVPHIIVLDATNPKSTLSSKLLESSLSVPFPLLDNHMYRVTAIVRHVQKHYFCHFWSESRRQWWLYDSLRGATAASVMSDYKHVEPHAIDCKGMVALVLTPLASLVHLKAFK